LTNVKLQNGYPKTFIASANTGGSAITVNGKNLYKPNTTTAPNLIAGKAYTIWYNLSKDCFFYKASAEGNTIVSHVLAGDTFSNDTDTGLVGTLDLTNVVSGNIRAGVTINGVSGSSTVVNTQDAILDPNYLVTGYSGYDDGVKKNGTLINLGASQTAYDTWTDGNGTLVYRVPSIGAFTSNVNGYKPEVNKYDGNFIASNIVSGKSIFGVAGSATIQSLGGTVLHYASGTTMGAMHSEGASAYYSNYLDLSGIGFNPQIVTGTAGGNHFSCIRNLNNAMASFYTAEESTYYYMSVTANMPLNNIQTYRFGYTYSNPNWAAMSVNWEAWGW
jgi:hypothetical protein